MKATTIQELHNELLAYGEIKADVQTEEKHGYRRIRVFEMNGKKYFDHMYNGDVIEVYEV